MTSGRATGNPILIVIISGHIRLAGELPHKPIAASTLPKMLRLHGIAAVAHGFRSSPRHGTDDVREL